MIRTKILSNAGKAGIVLNAVLLLTLTGCGGTADAPNNAAPAPAVTQTATTPDVQETSPAGVVQDDYVYYPSYGVYYNSRRHQYASLVGGAWVTEPAPRGVSVDVLRSSPSVKMDFHDAPAKHHAEIARQYPKNWKPSSAN